MKQATKSLKAQGKKLANVDEQKKWLNSQRERDFNEHLQRAGEFPLKSNHLEIMQINVGKMCNQVCEHCHVDAGPDRKEIMTKETMEACLMALDKTASVTTIDLTGGAPEMNPNFTWFVEELSKRGKEVIVRSNLTILLANEQYKSLPAFFAKHNIHVIASLPCYTQGNVDKQRGDGVFSKSIQAIKILNELGYGKSNSELTLDFVYNPGGASLPGDQMRLQNDYKKVLKADFNIDFNNLYTITNMPISRFLDYLMVIGKDKEYLELLANAFNPNAIKGLMCKNTLSISWDGDLYDCDFNQMLEMPAALKNKTIFNFNPSEFSDRNIVVNQHCFGCTAGAGSSCQGALA